MLERVVSFVVVLGVLFGTTAAWQCAIDPTVFAFIPMGHWVYRESVGFDPGTVFWEVDTTGQPGIDPTNVTLYLFDDVNYAKFALGQPPWHAQYNESIYGRYSSGSFAVSGTVYFILSCEGPQKLKPHCAAALCVEPTILRQGYVTNSTVMNSRNRCIDRRNRGQCLSNGPDYDGACCAWSQLNLCVTATTSNDTCEVPLNSVLRPGNMDDKIEYATGGACGKTTCGDYTDACGNGLCLDTKFGPENGTSCPQDCNTCGDGQCTVAGQFPETCSSCPEDCCPDPTTTTTTTTTGGTSTTTTTTTGRGFTTTGGDDDDSDANRNSDGASGMNPTVGSLMLVIFVMMLNTLVFTCM